MTRGGAAVSHRRIARDGHQSDRTDELDKIISDEIISYEIILSTRSDLGSQTRRSAPFAERYAARRFAAYPSIASPRRLHGSDEGTETTNRPPRSPDLLSRLVPAGTRVEGLGENGLLARRPFGALATTSVTLTGRRTLAASVRPGRRRRRTEPPLSAVFVSPVVVGGPITIPKIWYVC